MSNQQLLRLSRQLVQHLAPDVNPSQSAEYVHKQLKADTRGGTRKEWSDVTNALNGLSRSARIRVQDDLAEGFDKALGVLLDHKRKSGGGWEGDLPVKMSNLPEHIQLLLNLAIRPTSRALKFAHDYLNRPDIPGPSPDQILYQQIMSEPFSGVHWGKGFDDEVKEGWTDSEDDSVSSSDTENEKIITPSIERVDKRELERRELVRKVEEGEQRYRVALEKLRSFGRYWVEGGTDMPQTLSTVYGWKDVCEKSYPAGLSHQLSDLKLRPKVISAGQLQRELLFALSGRPNILLAFDNTLNCHPILNHPQMRHFSPQALEGILLYIAQRASQAARIRSFLKDSATPAESSSTNRTRLKTKEAFAEGCRELVSEFDSWIAKLESAFTIGNSEANQPATPLALRAALDSQYGTLLDDLTAFIPLVDAPVVLLNMLYSHINTPFPSPKIYWLFIQTAKPMWSMLSDWLQRGMPIPSSFTSSDEYSLNLDDDERQLEEEFFIRRDKDVSWTDEDFWECGYVEHPDAWPNWMGDTRDIVIEAGKAKGLIRALLGGLGDLEPWVGLEQLLAADGSVPQVDVRTRIKNFFEPRCLLVTFQLRRVLEENCGLEEHLRAVEGVMYMREGGVMDEWVNWLYDQVQWKKRWNDMQSLTSSIRDIVDRNQAYHLNPSAMRMTIQYPKGAGVFEMVRGIRPVYNMPFPLSVIFTASTLELRAQAFGLLVGLAYVRKVLANLRLQDTGEEGKNSWLLRQRLIWITNTLWAWVCDVVIGPAVRKYEEGLATTTSLEAMIQLELSHTRRIRTALFLHDKTADVHENMLKISQIAISLHNLQVGQQSAGQRQRKYKGQDKSSDAELSETEEGGTIPAWRAIDVNGRLIEMDDELHQSVGEIRKGLEDLISEEICVGEEETREVWSVLSLLLEDWR